MEPGERIIQQIVSGDIRNANQLQRAKVQLCKDYGIDRLLLNSEILDVCPPELKDRVISLLRKKPTRTLSGVAVLALMTKPAPCPHGKCDYCPGGVDYGTPQSYTGREPAALRAIEFNFDPYRQTEARLRQLEAIGHAVDKVDVIVMGGTFTFLDPRYRTWFVRRCLDAMNGIDSRTILEAQTLNESAKSRCIGLTVETRPDTFGEKEVSHSMSLGATRVELGVQSTDDRLLKRIHRGHGSKESIEATRLSKDKGMKVCYHMMPGLPGASFEKDLGSFREIFTDERYKPDMIKIYPVLVVEGTELFESWKSGEYEPCRDEEVAQLLAEIKAIVPEWVRIQRIQRDIPAPLIVDGVRRGDIRLLAQEVLERSGRKCNCIRCREIGRVDSASRRNPIVEMERTEYDASGGRELFLSMVERESDGLVAYIRMRRSRGKARVRELKVLGETVPVNESAGKRWQHKGYGKELLKECEQIAREEWGIDSLLVTSGVGARPYYRKLGYELVPPYMVKELG